ncbi:MAG TPA: Rap1a/Tai family immunity protein [Myxococcota bacterium]|nr:Rap1a/Tai family immunity protein [Myxococcota bacterium]
MRRLPAAGIVVALCLAGSSHGQGLPPAFQSAPYFKSGNALVEACAVPDSTCVGYVDGVSDTIAALSWSGMTSKTYCLPDQVTDTQLAAVFYKYLHDHPAQRHLSAAGLLINALADSFPCKTNAGKK